MSISCQPSSDDVFGPAVRGCRSNFDFTLLFEQSILTIGPAALFLLLAPLRVAKLLSSSSKTLPSKVRFSKSLLAILLIGVRLGLLICWSSNHVTRATVPSATLSFVAVLAIIFLSHLEHSRSIKPSFILSVYLLVSIAFDATQLRTVFLRHDEPAILGLSTANVAIKLALLVLESMSKRKYLKVPYNSYPPEVTSGIFNRSFFWWINPILATGFRKLITLNDLFKTDSSLKSEVLLVEMETSWFKYRASGKYALLYASLHCLRWELAATIFPRFCLIGFNYAQPFLISSVIDYVSKPDQSRNRSDGYGLIAATGLIYLGIAITTTHYKHHVNRTITAFRGAMVTIIYSKTLKLPAGLYNESAALTLMSTDIDRLASSLDSLNEIWARIIEISIGIWLLERQLGWICVAPIVIVLLSVFASGLVTKRIGPRQANWVRAIQQRVSITSSMLGSMKSVKMMGLSSTLFDTLDSHRVRELNISKHFRMMGLWRIVISYIPPTIGPLACFVIFAIQASRQGSDQLNAGQTFSSLTIISLVTSPATSFLQSLPMVGMSTGCLNRIQTFLLSGAGENDIGVLEYLSSPTDKEISPGFPASETPFELQRLQANTLGNHAIIFKKASISPSSVSSAVLHDLDIQIEKGSLTMIVGLVGAGKSTLLKAMIGELQCSTGTLEVDFTHKAYCAQTPWLPNSTVRQIICGYQHTVVEDQKWYNTVLFACVFDEDVRMLPDGDESIIGSRGVTLSGGQKQRLALARAVYSRLSLIVLDDVLSAVDARTEELLTERLFGKTGLLQSLNSTVILATHAIRHLPLADKVIVLGTEGRIAEQGTYSDLKSRDGFVSRLLLDPELLRSKSTDNTIASHPDPNTMPTTSLSRTLRGPTKNDVEDLTRQVGDFSVYKYYLKSVGWKLALINGIACLIWAVTISFPSLWLNWYATGTVTSLPLFASIYVVVAVLALSSITTTLWSLYMFITPKSGIKLHKILLKSVMRAPQSFFDETDSGITLNRFSQDMTLIDGQLPNSAALALASGFGCLAQIALIAIGSTYMVIACPFLLLGLYILQKFYLRTSRQMRLLDLEHKSPLYTHFTETLEGLSTIRAFGWERQFANMVFEHLDISQQPFYLLFCIQRWANLFLLLLVGIAAVALVALAISLVGTTSPGRLGVALSSVAGFNSSLTWLLMFWVQLETSLGAIARLKAFEEGTIPEDKDMENFVPSEKWPSRGAIEFKDVSASYRDNPPALRNVSFSIQQGEKIGICGRTGSGKSSLLSVLLRILDNSSGTITIDDLDLSIIPREIIRSRINTIPQEPFILSGSVRLNADPSGVAADEIIITALTKVGLWTILESRGGLEAEMTANPLSQGQQQIFCLARAMLRKGSRILVLDEATSNVDANTDGVIQRLIKEEFKEWTIVTVAHRLDSILDSDRILVLDEGAVVENGAPNALLERKGAFWRLRGVI